jgi:hypothetical protein
LLGTQSTQKITNHARRACSKFTFQGIFSGKTPALFTTTPIYFSQKSDPSVRSIGIGAGMNKVMKSGAVITAAVAISLAGTTASFAVEAPAPVVKKVALSPEQKAAFEAAKAQFKAARDTRQAAIAAAKANIATAKSSFDAAKAAATTQEAHQAARAALKAAVAAAKATVPTKPIKPARP